MWNFGKQGMPTKDELYIRDIIVEYLKNEKVKKEVTPTSNVYYLSNFDENIFIMMTSSTIQMTNHKFFYKKSFAIGFVDDMKKLVDKSIEEEKETFRKRIFSNEIDLLRGIFKEVRVEKPKLPVYKKITLDSQIKELSRIMNKLTA